MNQPVTAGLEQAPAPEPTLCRQLDQPATLNCSGRMAQLPGKGPATAPWHPVPGHGLGPPVSTLEPLPRSYRAQCHRGTFLCGHRTWCTYVPSLSSICFVHAGGFGTGTQEPPGRVGSGTRPCLPS